jgi:hypothetical protein
MATIAVFGQNETKQINVDVEEVKVTPPKFTGVENATVLYEVGISSLIDNYIANYFVCSDRVIDYKIEGTEIIQFTVNPDGRLTNFHVINSVCREIDEELIKILQGTNGMWMPGFNNGEPTAMEQEVSFMIGDYNQDEIVNHFVDQAEKYFIMGSTKLMTDHKPKKALRYYSCGLRYLPYDKSQLMMRGICHYELGDIESAKQDWDRVAALGGIDLNNVGKEVTSLGAYSEMKEILTKK